MVLEVLQNMYAMNLSTAFDRTVAAIRRVQPRAAILFAVWLKPHMLVPRVMMELRAFAEANRVDLAEMPAAMKSLALSVNDLYASFRGRVDHHPNAMGHELLGRLAARCIMQRMDTSGTNLEGDADAEGDEDGVRMISWSGTGSERSHLDASTHVRRTPELCYNSADAIPVPTQKSGFVLQDDGANKGVKKLGYSSTHVGDRLTIGPVNLLAHANNTTAGQGGAYPQRLCYMNVRVRLGYLVSTSPGMGLLHGECSGGCSCRPVKSEFLRSTFPFPYLDANAYHVPEWGLDSNETVTMTAHTVFIAQMNHSLTDPATDGTAPRSTACYLHLHHVKSARPHPLASKGASRVRVDSIALLVHGDPANVVPCTQEV